MRYETVLGLRKEPTFDDVRKYIQADPPVDKIQFPKRDALFLRQSHIYAAVEQGMRGDYAQARVDRANYEASDQPAPYVPPRPKPPRGSRDAPMPQAPTDTSMEDEITGPPPPPQPPSNGYAQVLRGTSTAQALAAEGIQPAPPPPALPLMINPQPPPPPPPPAAGMVGMAYPTAAPQTFAPEQAGFGGYGPQPPPPPSGARQTVQGLAHTAGHSFASSAGSAAGHAVGAAAIGALLARVGGAAAMGVEGGPAGILGGAVVGAAAEMGVHGLMNRRWRVDGRLHRFYSYAQWRERGTPAARPHCALTHPASCSGPYHNRRPPRRGERACTSS
jgi:hypothetical protein